jgi:hypothetical protein
MISSVEFNGAMPETTKFDGEKPLTPSSAQDDFAGATASKPPSSGASN